MFRKTPDVEFQRIDKWSSALPASGASRLLFAPKSADKIACQNARHPGRESAVRSESDAVLLRLGAHRQHLANDRIVSAKIGEVAAGSDRRARESNVKEVRNSRKSAVVLAHQRGDGGFVGSVDRDRPNRSAFLSMRLRDELCRFLGFLNVG